MYRPMKWVLLLAFSISLLRVIAAGAGGIPAPTGQKTLYYAMVDRPVRATNPARAAPVTVGPLATGGNTMTLSLALEAFAQPVDLYLGFLVPGYTTLLVMNAAGELKGIDEGLAPWRSGVSQPLEATFFSNLAEASLPEGDYRTYLLAVPAGASAYGPDSTLWTSSFRSGGGEQGAYEYNFFIDYLLHESVTLTCPGPCATTVVPSVSLKISGGFNIQNSKVVGVGTTAVVHNDACRIEEWGGGGAGYSCNVTGSVAGSFAIGGQVAGTTSVTGYGFQPTVQMTLSELIPVDLVGTHTWVHPVTGVATTFPLTYYAGIFTDLLQQSGLYGAAFVMPTVVCDGWMTDALVAKITTAFAGSLTVPGATGSQRHIEGRGRLFFSRSPFHIAGDVASVTAGEWW